MVFRNLIYGRRGIWLASAAEFFSVAVFVLGFSALLGYAIGKPSWYQWGGPSMALPTAIACTLTGFILFTFSNLIAKLEIDAHPQEYSTLPTLAPRNIHPSDVIALLVIIACFSLVATGHDGVILPLTITVGFLFGRNSATRTKPSIVEIEKTEE